MIDWRGDDVVATVREATAVALNKTMGRAVVSAKRNHSWRNQTTVLEGAIDIVSYAKSTRRSGRWGVRSVKYARIHELGGIIRPVKASALKFKLPDGQFVTVKSVRIPPRPYLGPAAAKEYPKLAGYIREELAK